MKSNAIRITITFITLCLTLDYFLPSFYETDDDPLMSFISGGILIGSRPNEHILYSSFIIGSILKHLNICGVEDAYFVWMKFLFWVSFPIIVYCLINNFKGYKLILAFSFLTLCFFRFNLLPQFSTYAFMLALAGILMTEHMRGVGSLVLAFFIIVFSSLVRFELTIFIVFIYLILQLLTGKSYDQKAYLYILSGIILMVALNYMDSLYYNGSDNFKNYRAYNKLITKYSDYKIIDKNDPKLSSRLEKKGFTENDLGLVRDRTIYPNSYFTFDRLRELETVSKGSDFLNFKRLKRSLRVNLLDNKTVQLLVVVTIILGIACIRRKNCWRIIFKSLLMLAVYICLALFMKTPERIIVPLLMVLFLVFLSAYDLRFNLLVYPIVVTVIIFLGSFIYNFWDMHVKFDADGKLLTQEIDKYSNVFGLHSGKIFLLRPVWPYRLHNFSRITDKKLYGVPSNYLYSGLYPDLTNGPVNGLYHKLVKDNYLVIYTDKHKLSHLKNYYKEHLGYSVSDSTLIISKLFRACVLSKVKPVK